MDWDRVIYNGTVAVSYTHLDVYKRQVHQHAGQGFEVGGGTRREPAQKVVDQGVELVQRRLQPFGIELGQTAQEAAQLGEEHREEGQRDGGDRQVEKGDHQQRDRLSPEGGVAGDEGGDRLEQKGDQKPDHEGEGAGHHKAQHHQDHRDDQSNEQTVDDEDVYKRQAAR